MKVHFIVRRRSDGFYLGGFRKDPSPEGKRLIPFFLADRPQLFPNEGKAQETADNLNEYEIATLTEEP